MQLKHALPTLYLLQRPLYPHGDGLRVSFDFEVPEP